MNAPAKEPALRRLLLHEVTQPSGKLGLIWLELLESALGLRFDEGDVQPVPLAVLAAVMRRYGRPLGEDTQLEGPTLCLPGGERLTSLRHLARFDIIAKDYLVYQPVHGVPLVELATGVSAALSFLLSRSLRAAP